MRTQIRNKPGKSSYFEAQYRGYGRYQWNIKYYGFKSECEIEDALFWAFGEHVKLKSNKYGFLALSEILGREIESHIDGRSGGWLVVNTELREYELKKIDKLVQDSLKELPNMLEELRKFIIEESK